ncbi:MAG: FliA/WhiG family RNA polymerase sigma factor [Lachnospiraceae bacterium]|nr:FliA/WhiG family RNA polymerase sigma factor [Lachnospiraceae bacterium]
MKEEERNALWDAYEKKQDPAIREKLIVEYIPLVKVVAGRLNMYLGYAVEYEDLVSYGIFGLIDAIDKFNLLKGNKFETYASLRIRGAILDQIRKMDWIPRSVRQKQKQIDSAISKIETTMGKQATDDLVASELGIDIDEYYNWQGQITSLSSLDEYLEMGNDYRSLDVKNGTSSEPEAEFERQELKEKLSKAFEALKDNEQKVISLYYYEDMTIKEISHVLELSESRISQIHTKALSRMKQYLGDDIRIMLEV